MAHMANPYVTTSQVASLRLPISDKMIPYVASTMDPSAFAINTPGEVSFYTETRILVNDRV